MSRICKNTLHAAWNTDCPDCAVEMALEGITTRARRTRDDAAELYYSLLLSHPAAARINWRAVNEAIIARWSESGLVYVKRKAWAMAEGARSRLEGAGGEAPASED